MNVENQDQQIKEVKNIISLIALKRKHGDSSMEAYIRYPGTIEHLKAIGYDISEIEKDPLIKLRITW